jgi:cell division inhibitor SepF
MGIFTKLKDFVGLTEAQEYEYEYDEASSSEYQGLYQEENGAIAAAEPEEPQSRRTRERPTALRATPEGMSNVIGMPGAANGLSQVMVMEPRSFEEMPQAIQALRERKSVVLNLTMMDPDQAPPQYMARPVD